jgi:hypothetical protein
VYRLCIASFDPKLSNKVICAGFGKNVVIDAHRCSGSRIHLDHRSAGRSVIQDHSSDHRFKRLHLTRASVRRASGFVLTGKPEVMNMAQHI